jgi:hypothetical protein
MAYTATVTKQSVTEICPNIYSVSINVVVNDGSDDVFEASASAGYRSTEPDLDGIKARLIQSFKVKWDKWVVEQQIFNAAAFDTMISGIQTTANSYINS